jgi:hypothetical protein
MEKVYDNDLISYVRNLSESITKDKLSHIMRSRKDYVLYYYRKKEDGGNYTIKIPLSTIDDFLKSR